MISKNFWKGKRVFLSGHTGFKGSWIALWLNSLGAEVKGYALRPSTTPSLFEEAKIGSIIESQIGDIRDESKLQISMMGFNPDILIHMAAQPLVRYSYNNPLETYEVNVIGTVKILEAARKCNNLKAIINVTSDKCYENDNRVSGFKESDPIGGHDPYSSSKGCSELVTSSYQRSFFKGKGVGLASARAGNVIGGGDWANDRLIPDILKSFNKGLPVIIRNPKSIRPWQHVLEPLSGYLVLAQNLFEKQEEYSGAWNFGPKLEDAKPVEWILDKMIEKWPNTSWEIDKKSNPHEEGHLKLDIEKAQDRLGWSPVWGINMSLDKIILWNKAWLNDDDIKTVCLNEINQYMKDLI